MIPDLDPSSPIPLYLQIVESVRRLVATGAVRKGERFLTVRELGIRARVNRNTAARAIQELERAGILRTRVGQGTFVADGTPSIEPAKAEASMNASLDRLIIESHSLGIPPEELGWRLSRRIEAFHRTREAAARELPPPDRTETER